MLDYIRDGAEIYARSFAIIRAEARLDAIPPDLEKLAVRMAHASGMVDIVGDLRFSPGAGAAGRQALAAGAAILVDGDMVRRGITRARLPADNRVITLDQGDDIAPWLPHIEGSVTAIGLYPTALTALLETAARPALVLGFPAGFEGAADAKARLAQSGLPFVIVAGTRGGSAMAAAALNALAQERE
ncbi:MAG TPA: precorrin-8X methylmutase [Devosiaceae bacterium]